MKVLLGIPCGGTVKAKLLTTAVESLFSAGVPMGLMIRESAIGCDNRWHMAREAVNGGYTHLWLVDNDMSFPADTFQRLLAHDKDIVGAAYNYRAWPRKTIVKMLGPDGPFTPDVLPTELFKVHHIGNGCQLIKVEALKRIPQPWFAYQWREDGSLEMCEDGWFCEQARKVGIDTWCDPTIDAKHIGDFEY